MQCVLFAESAILVHLESVGIVFLVLHSVVISLLALCACHCDLYAHSSAPPVLPPCLNYREFFAQKNKPYDRYLEL